MNLRKNNDISYERLGLLNEYSVSKGFAIIELVIIIIVIGVLSGVAIVAYKGITQNTSNVADKNNPQSGNSNKTTPQSGNSNLSPLATTDPANWVQIGSQVWGRYNLNVGTRIEGKITQKDNEIVEKYCYDNTDAGCTNTDSNGVPYGALYQWDEAMQHSNAPGAQGICPNGSHIPTDEEWGILEISLGMTQSQVDLKDKWRGTDQGAQMKSGGTSELNFPLAGNRHVDTKFGHLFNKLTESAYFWSSSAESGARAWNRSLSRFNSNVDRYNYDKEYGFSVRCIGN